MRSRDHDVVLVGRTIDLGCWEFGMRREWGGDGKGEVRIKETGGSTTEWTRGTPEKIYIYIEKAYKSC
jgi:hypothetical protein